VIALLDHAQLHEHRPRPPTHDNSRRQDHQGRERQASTDVSASSIKRSTTLQVRLEWSNFPFVVQGVPPEDLFETGQLWFLVLLLTFSLLLLPAFWWLRRRPGQGPLARLAPLAARPGEILLPAIPLGLTSAAFHLEEPHAAWSRWSYLLFFVYGFVRASDRRYLSAMHRHTAAATAVGLATFVVGFGIIAAADTGGDPFVDYRPLSVVGRFLFGVTGWLWLVAILGLLTRPPPTGTRPASPGGRLRSPAGPGRRCCRSTSCTSPCSWPSPTTSSAGTCTRWRSTWPSPPAHC
jgi:hypothetical protein